MTRAAKTAESDCLTRPGRAVGASLPAAPRPADLTIVIPSYDTSDRLAACLEAIADSSARHPELDLDVIVVDNGSSDDSVDRAASASFPVRVVALVRNRGFAAAVNIGLGLRRGRHVLLLNSDARIDPELPVRGLTRLDSDPTIGLLGAALQDANGRPQRSAHAIPDLWSELLPVTLARRLRAGGTRSGLARPSTIESATGSLLDVEAVRGAVLFVRGELIDTLGPLDEGYFFFLEDTDYCARARRSGARVVEDASLVAVHVAGASSKRRAPLATRIEYHRSLYRFLERSHGATVARVARVARTLRSLVSVMLLMVPALGSTRARAKVAQRLGLVLWHLRGCPAEPALAEALGESGGGEAR